MLDLLEFLLNQHDDLFHQYLSLPVVSGVLNYFICISF